MPDERSIYRPGGGNVKLGRGQTALSPPVSQGQRGSLGKELVDMSLSVAGSPPHLASKPTTENSLLQTTSLSAFSIAKFVPRQGNRHGPCQAGPEMENFLENEAAVFCDTEKNG